MWAVDSAAVIQFQEDVDNLLDIIEAFKTNASADYEERNERLAMLAKLADATHIQRVKNIEAKRQRGLDLIQKSEERAMNVTERYFNLKQQLEERKVKNQERFARKMLRFDAMINKISAGSPAPPPPETQEKKELGLNELNKQNEPALCTEPTCLLDVGTGFLLG